MKGAGQEQQGAPGTQSRATSAQAGESGRVALRFDRSARLLKHAAFDRVYQEGQRIFSGNITVFFRRRDPDEATGGPRVGFTVSRAMGGSVQRNRIRRRLREAVRLNLPGFQVRADVVINPKRTTAEAEFTQLVGEVARAFGQIQQRMARTGSAEDPKATEGAKSRRGRSA